ncbi:hypothetical protein MYCTH_2296527 [Thermothelomyces thermophilus ATCC 42464]|uniref:Ubiquitin carboxyl-terminal hydrolase n=1 Tax=Thermothelomyces thermophilus (strain ATCC 42464 / BCRC 31852 / DSM 1799) TaxID=573729 RepID=G2Q1Y1_THET4|nr:uncharacterized protein MYCTH_2296527 [Thermothelomyces thermophilus ATCC 42464]AEO54213.1 hypothetical protein MYCTH_2296527 [Thermothelomyces thermophilus ATCC 42464]
MPDKALRVVTYAAGASLAAITLIYVFGPTYFLDGDTSRSGTGAFSTRKAGVVGLSNPANDCFINSVLQALAGLGDLRLYLIREVHRRRLDDETVYTQLVPADALAQLEVETGLRRFGKDIPGWKLEGLQRGVITKSLKDILDALNERPIHKKTISAAPFVRALEEAFRQRISRQQQDAHEFLQIVAERLCDEYHAGCSARWLSRRTAALDEKKLAEAQQATQVPSAELPQSHRPLGQTNTAALNQAAEASTGGAGQNRGYVEHQGMEEEEGFPLEGKFESQIECLTCGFKPRPTPSTFCTLTLHVPRVPSTTLSACFDGMFKTEYIDDFRCEKCRLLHALSIFEVAARRASSEEKRLKAQSAAEKLRLAIEKDPETPPAGVELPDLHSAPKRRIARHIRITHFPKILAIHLSRSIFDASRSSQKNLAKVAFPEKLTLGGLLQQRRYKLLGVVTHKGSHHSGHYESFRRQNIYPPFSNPSTFQASGVYSRTPSPASTPRADLRGQPPQDVAAPTSAGRHSDSAPPCHLSATPAAGSRDSLCDSTRGGESSADARSGATPVAAAQASNSDSGSRDPTETTPQLSIPGAGSPPPRSGTPGAQSVKEHRLSTHSAPAARTKQRKQQSRWWRISDDKIKEANTRDVLGMQREVYLMFYELERPYL